jgi:hypothetical protein
MGNPEVCPLEPDTREAKANTPAKIDFNLLELLIFNN